MFRNHGAVQVEVDGVEPAGRGDAVDHHLCDALEGILLNVRRRGCSGEDGRHQLPIPSLGLFDKSRQADIDVAHDPEHISALRHRWPAAAMHKIFKSRLGRREGVGLVQKTANGDAGH
jgi:hypothetical protein